MLLFYRLNWHIAFMKVLANYFNIYTLYTLVRNILAKFKHWLLLYNFHFGDMNKCLMTPHRTQMTDQSKDIKI